MIITARKADLVAAGVLVTLAAIAVWESTRWPAAAAFAGNPTLLPRALGVLLVLTAIALVTFPARAAATDGALRPGMTLVAIGATAALAALLPLLGVIGTGIPYLLSLQRLGGARWPVAVPSSIAAPVMVWFAFAKGLNVPLPSGRLWAALLG